MRDAMKAADAVGKFKRIGFDLISLRSENRLRTGIENTNPVSPAYVRPSVNIMRAQAGLEYLRDVKNTELAFVGIK